MRYMNGLNKRDNNDKTICWHKFHLAVQLANQNIFAQAIFVVLFIHIFPASKAVKLNLIYSFLLWHA